MFLRATVYESGSSPDTSKGRRLSEEKDDSPDQIGTLAMVPLVTPADQYNNYNNKSKSSSDDQQKKLS